MGQRGHICEDAFREGGDVVAVQGPEERRGCGRLPGRRSLVGEGGTDGGWVPPSAERGVVLGGRWPHLRDGAYPAGHRQWRGGPHLQAAHSALSPPGGLCFPSQIAGPPFYLRNQQNACLRGRRGRLFVGKAVSTKAVHWGEQCHQRGPQRMCEHGHVRGHPNRHAEGFDHRAKPHSGNS